MLFALYQKISKIVAESPEELGYVIVRLGGFHLWIIFHGFDWPHHGWEWTWGTVEHCACTFICVTHVTGHAYSCTLRAHFLTQEASATILLKASNCTWRHPKTVFVKFITVFWKVLTVVAELLNNIQRICDNTKELWIQYFELIVRLLSVQKERDWHLHLYCVKRMLLSRMLQHILPTPNLLTTMCNTCKSWSQRSNTCSSLATLLSTAHTNFGVEFDMIIEQALMRAINTPGGLTGGWGISESTIAR